MSEAPSKHEAHYRGQLYLVATVRGLRIEPFYELPSAILEKLPI